MKNKEKKQVEALKALESEENHGLETTEGHFPNNMRTVEIKNEIDETRKWELKLNKKT